MEKDLTAIMEEIHQSHLREKPLFDARPITGKRFAVPRDGAEPVDTILYQPAEPPAGPMPALLNMHGGGFIGGDAVLMDSFCRMLADALGMLVVNVNYKKAPEYPFPYMIHEVTDTAEYFAAHAGEYGMDPARIAIGGHSAGASLAAGAALKARDDGRVTLACQLLVYPCTEPVSYTHLDVYKRQPLRAMSSAAVPLVVPSANFRPNFSAKARSNFCTVYCGSGP